ncbi:amphi-Trp domain-containing protein [Saliphagus infecundisoli]|uniref:Amphi-Trp domain-containing protein n=1 Tax=Saliphagus infecundisoli TaxID=1849069 RepID=A0ABD5QJ53_9EURY
MFKTFYVDPPTTVIFEAEVEDEGEEVGAVERNIEFELKWQAKRETQNWKSYQQSL